MLSSTGDWVAVKMPRVGKPDAGLPATTVVGRYHSLIVEEATLPDCFEVSARGGGVIQGIRHKVLPVEGVQFHPESVLTPDGRHMLANFLAQAATPAAG